MSQGLALPREVDAAAGTVLDIIQSGLFPYARWQTALPALRRQYSLREPFPHAHLVDFFDAGVAARIADEFPRSTTEHWVHWKHYNENKLGLTKRALFPPFVG